MSSTVARTALEHLCRTALEAAGAVPDAARVLAGATVDAEARGRRGSGVSHLFDYLEGIREGRIDGHAVPRVEQPAPATIRVDAAGGLAHLAFDRGRDRLVEAARTVGVAVLGVGDAFTSGELAWYARNVASSGLVALATTNSPALMSIGGAPGKVIGTNPMAFAARTDGSMVLIDQSSSVTAFVNVRAAVASGAPIPPGWAVDERGEPTTDAVAALAGAVLPFGGYKGANVAVVVELLSGLAGGRWGIDAPPFERGTESPGVGLTVIAIDPARFSTDYPHRVGSLLERLRSVGVDVSHLVDREPVEECVVDAAVLDRLRVAAGLDDASAR